MQDYDGMRDAGMHHFDYAIKSYGAGFSENEAVADGIGYNIPLVPVNSDLDVSLLPILSGNDVRVGAVKRAEDKNSLIYRLVEYHGKDSSAVITLPD